MITSNFSILECELRQIADALLLNGTLTKCPGLVQGKMGIAIFFFHYAHYTNNTLFAEYAWDVIGEMQNQLHANYRADYEKGIAGIGVGIDYLNRSGFLDIEDDIFEDFDERMYRAVMYDGWFNFRLYEGLVGYGKYWMVRSHQKSSSALECLMYIISQIEKQWTDLSAEEQADIYYFLHEARKISDLDIAEELFEQLGKLSSYTYCNFSRLGNSIVGNVVHKIQSIRYCMDTNCNEIDSILKQIPILDREKSSFATGLLTGYAGEGLMRLTALRAVDTTWALLL
jgi:hypothetical protein